MDHENVIASVFSFIFEEAMSRFIGFPTSDCDNPPM